MIPRLDDYQTKLFGCIHVCTMESAEQKIINIVKNSVKAYLTVKTKQDQRRVIKLGAKVFGFFLFGQLYYIFVRNTNLMREAGKQVYELEQNKKAQIGLAYDQMKGTKLG